MAEPFGYSSVRRLRRSAPLPLVEYLKIDTQDQLNNFDGEYDIPENKIIKKGIRELLENSNISGDEKEDTTSIMRLIVTFYSKKIKQPYKRNNGWLNLLLPLIKMKYPPSIIFNLFEAMRNQFVPFEDNCEHILRLLFLYHDPELAQFLIQKRVFFHKFSAEWTSSLFAGLYKHAVTLAIWKNLFLYENSIIFYFILLIGIDNRSKILSLTSDHTDTITKTIAELPMTLKSDAISRYFLAAEYYKKYTPFSFENEFFPPTFGSPNEHSLVVAASGYICLPVLVEELTIDGKKIVSNQSTKTIEFILVDLRSVDEFKAGSYPNAVNLDYNVHFEDPSLFADKVDKLINLQSAKDPVLELDRHFCFMGSGRQEDDMFVKTFIDPILNLRMKYISLLKNGYQAVHDFFRENLDRLKNHDSAKCLICNSKFGESSGSSKPIPKSFFDKFMEKSSSDPIIYSSLSSKKSANHLSTQDFRIFSIDEYSNLPQTLHNITAIQLRKNDQEYECRIFITEDSIQVLRLVKDKSDLAYLILKCTFEQIKAMTISETRSELTKLFYEFESRNAGGIRSIVFLIPDRDDRKTIFSTLKAKVKGTYQEDKI